MTLTIAICTRNRCELLRATLTSICRITVPNQICIEVLVVANDCSDRTVEVAGEFAGRLPLRIIVEARPGLAFARNTAMDNAVGDWIAWTDDDVLVDASWLVELTHAIDAFPDAGVVGGFIEPWFPIEPDPVLRSVFPHLDIGFCGHSSEPAAGLADRHAPIWGANMATRASACSDLRLDASLGKRPGYEVSGEEVWLRHRILDKGYVAVWWPAMRVKHYVDPSRMCLPYLIAFTRGKGAEAILASGECSDEAPPFWLKRLRFEAAAREALSRLGLLTRPSKRLFSGPPPANQSRTSNVLLWRRERVYLEGMLQAWNERHALTETTVASRTVRG